MQLQYLIELEFVDEQQQKVLIRLIKQLQANWDQTEREIQNAITRNNVTQIQDWWGESWLLIKWQVDCVYSKTFARSA